MLNDALLYAQFGWAVFPISPNAKIPYKGTNGFKDATKDEEKIAAMFKARPNSNIGVATGAYSGIFVLDIDNKNGGKGDISLANLEAINGKLPETVEQFTPSGGRHLFFNNPTNIRIGSSASSLGSGLDIRGHGGYILVPPSIVDDKQYIWEASHTVWEFKIADAPQWLLSLCIEKKRNYDIDLNGKDRILNDGNRGERLFEIGVVARNSGLKDFESLFAYLQGVNLNNCRPPKSEKEVTSIVNSLLKYEDEKAEISKDNAELIFWDKGENNVLLKTYRNVLNFLKTEPELGDFSYNEFSHKITFPKKPFWRKNESAECSLEDNDILQMKQYLVTKNFQPSTATIIEGIQTIAYNKSHHPVREYLQKLEWDHVSRIENFATEYLGSEDSLYSKYISKLLFCAAVKRIMYPGCKYDYMIILEGRQGIGKSRALQAIGGEFFAEIPLTDRDRDTIDKMQGRWIIEVAELEVFQKKEIEALKSFLSTNVDRARLAYAKTTKDFPRQCVFIGTINPTELGYLRDITGNRRFLPISCNKIKVDEIAKNRDMFFAEALDLVKKDQQIYIDYEMEKLAAEEQAMRLVVDPWEQYIIDWINDPINTTADQIRTSDVWTHALNGQIDKLTRREQLRISHILRNLGYSYRTSWIDGKNMKVYVKEYEQVKWE
jgi:predicted P-loop ATPase